MSSSRMCIFKLNGDLAICDLGLFAEFEDIVKFVLSRYDTLVRGKFKLRYSCGDLEYVILGCAGDLIALVSFVDSFGVSSVTIKVEGDVVVDDNIRDTAESIFEVPNEDIFCGETGETSDVNAISRKHKALAIVSWVNEISGVGQVFQDGAVGLRLAVSRLALQKRFSFKYLHNNKQRITVYCMKNDSKGCPWRLYAKQGRSTGFFIIKKYVKTHTCVTGFNKENRKHFSSDLIGNDIRDCVRRRVYVTTKSVKSFLINDYGLDISYRVSWLALKKAKRVVYGDSSISYKLLKNYFKTSKVLDSNNDYILEYSLETNVFKRCFIAFRSCLYGFNSCRLVLFVDGTFLTGKYNGVLLSVIAKDGNNDIFPVAFNIVASEDTENWLWFLEMLKPHFLDREITFISDRHLGIVTIVSAMFPDCHNGYCLYHLMNNLRHCLRATSTTFKDTMVKLFKRCAYASNQNLFNQYMDELLKHGGEKVESFCQNLSSEKYACAFIKDNRYGSMASTPAESFNNQVTKQFCGLPILELIDMIRVLEMRQISRCFGDAERWTNYLCPEFDKKFKANVEEGHPWIVHSSTILLHEVFCDPIMVVDLGVRSISCGLWQHQCFPCSHVVDVIFYIYADPMNYVDPCYFVSSYKATYSYGIAAFTTFGQTSTSTTSRDLLLPVLKRRAERPKKKRIPSRGELSICSIKCSCFRKSGHNRRTCVDIS